MQYAIRNTQYEILHKIRRTAAQLGNGKWEMGHDEQSSTLQSQLEPTRAN